MQGKIKLKSIKLILFQKLRLELNLKYILSSKLESIIHYIKYG